MKILIKKITPEYTDVSTLQAYNFLCLGHRIEFSIVAGATKVEQFTIKGEFFLEGVLVSTKIVEEKVKDLVKKLADDNT